MWTTLYCDAYFFFLDDWPIFFQFTQFFNPTAKLQILTWTRIIEQLQKSNTSTGSRNKKNAQITLKPYSLSYAFHSSNTCYGLLLSCKYNAKKESQLIASANSWFYYETLRVDLKKFPIGWLVNNRCPIIFYYTKICLSGWLLN